MPAALRALAALGLSAALLSGCAPGCEQTCRKLIRCELADNVAQLECEESCTRQDAQYELEEDDASAKAFREHRRCIGASTCEEIEDGECYDEDVFVF